MVTEILETRIKTQKSSKYGQRFYIIVITEFYYYELVYRFHKEFEPHLTVTRMTYGKVHETQSGFTRVLWNKNAVVQHAHRTVNIMESKII